MPTTLESQLITNALTTTACDSSRAMRILGLPGNGIDFGVSDGGLSQADLKAATDNDTILISKEVLDRASAPMGDLTELADVLDHELSHVDQLAAGGGTVNPETFDCEHACIWIQTASCKAMRFANASTPAAMATACEDFKRAKRRHDKSITKCNNTDSAILCAQLAALGQSEEWVPFECTPPFPPNPSGCN